MNKVALITGASSGIGLETALSLLKKGFTVYGAARRLSLMKKIEENGGTILYLDLTDDNSIETCVKTIIQKEKQIDILINNSGYGLGGSIENVPIEQAKKTVWSKCIRPYPPYATCNSVYEKITFF